MKEEGNSMEKRKKISGAALLLPIAGVLATLLSAFFVYVVVTTTVTPWYIKWEWWAYGLSLGLCAPYCIVEFTTRKKTKPAGAPQILPALSAFTLCIAALGKMAQGLYFLLFYNAKETPINWLFLITVILLYAGSFIFFLLLGLRFLGKGKHTQSNGKKTAKGVRITNIYAWLCAIFCLHVLCASILAGGFDFTISVVVFLPLALIMFAKFPYAPSVAPSAGNRQTESE